MERWTALLPDRVPAVPAAPTIVLVDPLGRGRDNNPAVDLEGARAHGFVEVVQLDCLFSVLPDSPPYTIMYRGRSRLTGCPRRLPA
ncbi:hypothetical protein JCM10213v2_005420 [Rhodosporidiobolus nylandii]